jgi:hypothetical protein
MHDGALETKKGDATVTSHHLSRKPGYLSQAKSFISKWHLGCCVLASCWVIDSSSCYDCCRFAMS